MPAKTHQQKRAEDAAAVARAVAEIVADVSGRATEDVEQSCPLARYGLSDLALIQVQDLLDEEFGERTVGLDFDAPGFAEVVTVGDLIAFVCEQLGLDLPGPGSAVEPQPGGQGR